MVNKDSEGPVVFLRPDGTEISNDPRWHAQKLAQDLQGQAAAQSPAPPELNPEDPATWSGKPYPEWNGKALAKEARSRGLETKGLTKKSEFVALLEGDDAESNPDVEDDDEEENDDENTSEK
jgi:hypothetical protein